MTLSKCSSMASVSGGKSSGTDYFWNGCHELNQLFCPTDDQSKYFAYGDIVRKYLWRHCAAGFT